MSIQIVDKSLTIQLTVNGLTETIHKVGTGIHIVGDTVKIVDAAGRNTTVDFNEVTSPVVATVEELRQVLAVMISQATNILSRTTITTVVLNNSTTVILADENFNRKGLKISNQGPGTFYLKEQPAAIDNNDAGELVESGNTWFMNEGYIDPTEVSGKGKTGNPVVHVIEKE